MKKMVITVLGLLVSTLLAFTAIAAEEEHTVFVRGEHGKMVEVHADENSTEVEKDGKVVYSSSEEEQAQKNSATKQGEKDKK